MINQENNQSNFINRTRQLTRRCSFCRSTSHKINRCDSERLLNFQENLISRRNDLREIHSIDLNDKISYFKTWLLGQDHILIKSYAMRFCGAYSRHTLQNCIIQITNLSWNIQQNIWGNNEIYEQDYISLPNSSNSIDSIDL